MDQLPRQARRSLPQIWLGCAGLALVVAALLVAAISAGTEWTPPFKLSVTRAHSGQPVAEVQFASAAPVVADLEVVSNKGVRWSSALAPAAAIQTVAIPPRLAGGGSKVAVVSNGHILRWVDS